MDHQAQASGGGARQNVHPHAEMRIDEDRRRVELWDDVDGAETFIGFIGYSEDTIGGDPVMRLQHTVISPRFGRRGYARCLVTLLLEKLEADGTSFTSECSYIDDYLRRYPEHRRNLVAAG
ncbi:MAG: N-acetyltransferase [Nesterenkonia sp.]|uniref:GNAT family N-acetyltransferase n=1 Tax=Nesterenkonia marinintestina TaxID=2979865 RepID=UPI0021C2111D|nr:N-acetyltransferase [Nesterenkonia sp. GX14115]MDO5492667.1 N-acetyltransferase [Nesterenkonia sp.]